MREDLTAVGGHNEPARRRGLVTRVILEVGLNIFGTRGWSILTILVFLWFLGLSFPGQQAAP
jgi:hypothetical protein